MLTLLRSLLTRPSPPPADPALSDASPAMLWRAGPDKGRTDFSRRWYDYTGRTPHHEAGEGWLEGLHPDDAKRCLAVYLTHFDRRAPFDMHYRLRRHDGEYRWMLDRGEPRVEDGVFLGYAGVCLDMHESYQAEERMREHAQQLRLILSTSKIGTWQLDLRSGELTSSGQCKANFGLAASDPLTREMLYDFILPEDQDAARTAFQRALDDPDADYQIDYRVRWFDGSLHWLALYGQVSRDAAGQPLRMLGMSLEITERKEAEIALQAALEKANSANRAKSEFLANMSHELRTPMNAVVGLSHLMSLNAGLPERERDFVSTLRSSADALMLLINDMLDFGRIETKRFQLEPIVFPPALLVREAIDIVAIEAARKGLAITHRIDLSPGLQLRGDPLRLRQVLMNLLSNAVKFTERGEIGVTAEVEDGVLCLAVRDTGIGMSQEVIATIFEKFTQADASSTRKYGGAGLGLAISKSLIDLMDGDIAVESLPGQGSVFTIRVALPVVTGGDGMAPAPDPSSLRLLLVEDYEANIVVATHLLESFGYACDVARSGTEALSLVEREHYALVLMDVQMKGMDGMETTRRLRSRESAERLPHLPVIAVTAHALASDRDLCFAAGMDDYVAKPFDPDLLHRKIEAILFPARAA